MHSINSLANHSIDLSSSSTTSTTHIDMSDELPQIPQEEPQLNPDEQVPSASSVISPTTVIELDPFLVDDEDEGDSHSEEDATEENTSSDANSHQVVSPSEAVPLDLPTSPEVSTPQPQPLLPNLQKDVPPPPSEHEEEEEEYVPEIYVPALIVPTMFLPIPNVRRPFSPNLLTWWLSRNSKYYNCTRPIL